MSDNSVHVARFDRLTPRELRVLVLSIDGDQTTADIAGVLGTTRGTVQSIRQSVRRKLAVPPHVDLRWFIESVPGLQDLVNTERRAPEEAPTPQPDRRSKVVLRSALRELEELAARTAARASALAALSSDDASIGDEVHLLRTIADSLTTVNATAIERARMASSYS